MLYVMSVVALPLLCQKGRFWSAATLLLFGAYGCARTGLYPGDLGPDLGEDPGSTASGGNAGATSVGGVTTGGAGAAGAGTAGMAGAGAGGVIAVAGSAGAAGAPVTVEPGPMCTPQSETCNGRDDDCNGAVDDLPAQPCPGGGFRFCVAGRMSECPRRCDVCVPGSTLICQNSFCSFWGEQQCTADGQGFGHCMEADPPVQCRALAKATHDSPELEQCCLDNGFCCLDAHDLDHDGDRHEMLGNCKDVACQ